MKAKQLPAGDVQSKIGSSLPPEVLRVERGAIKRFADAVGYSNPLYYDEEEGRKSEYQGIIAPPGFFGWPIGQLLSIEEVLQAFGCPAGSVLNGGTEVSFYMPVRPGDVLIATRSLRSAIEKDGSLGKMLIMTIETTYLNQDAALVAVSRDTFIIH